MFPHTFFLGWFFPVLCFWGVQIGVTAVVCWSGFRSSLTTTPSDVFCSIYLWSTHNIFPQSAKLLNVTYAHHKPAAAHLSFHFLSHVWRGYLVPACLSACLYVVQRWGNLGHRSSCMYNFFYPGLWPLPPTPPNSCMMTATESRTFSRRWWR